MAAQNPCLLFLWMLVVPVAAVGIHHKAKDLEDRQLHLAGAQMKLLVVLVELSARELSVEEVMQPKVTAKLPLVKIQVVVAEEVVQPKVTAKLHLVEIQVVVAVVMLVGGWCRVHTILGFFGAFSM